MRRLRLWEGTVRLLFNGMSQIRKFDGVLNEKHRDIVAHQIPVPLLGVELRGKTTNIAREIERPGATRDSGKAHEHFGLLTDLGKNIGGGVVCQ